MSWTPWLLAALLLSQTLLFASYLRTRPGSSIVCLGTNGATPNSSEPVRLSAACEYFFGEKKFEDMCDASKAAAFAAEATAQGSCVPAGREESGPGRPLRFHLWAINIPWEDGDRMRWLLLTLKAWLITQNLERSVLTFWTSASDVQRYQEFLKVKKDINESTSFILFEDPEYNRYIELKVFDYEEEVKTTPLELSSYWRNWTAVTGEIGPRAALNAAPSVPLSDIVRSILLHNYGGIWLDTDAVPLRDLYNISAGVGLQFIPKWGGSKWGGDGGFSNSHVMWVSYPRAPLARRRLEHMLLFPYSFQEAWPRQPQTGLKSWVFNDALPEHTRADQAQLYGLPPGASSIPNPGGLSLDVLENIEIPYPLGWFDPIWPCEKDLYDTFAQSVECKSFFVWHRLNKPQDRPNDAKHLGMLALWKDIEGIYERREITVEPRVLTTGIPC